MFVKETTREIEISIIIVIVVIPTLGRWGDEWGKRHALIMIHSRGRDEELGGGPGDHFVSPLGWTSHQTRCAMGNGISVVRESASHIREFLAENDPEPI